MRIIAFYIRNDTVSIGLDMNFAVQPFFFLLKSTQNNLYLASSVVSCTMPCSTFALVLKVTTATLLLSGTTYLIRFCTALRTHFQTGDRELEVSISSTYRGNGSRTMSILKSIFLLSFRKM